MPTPKLTTIEAWSYSRFTVYEQCPYKAKLTILERRREPEHPACANGHRVHAIAGVVASGALPEPTHDNEHFMAELSTVLRSAQTPPELARFKKEFARLKKLDVRVEEDWAFDCRGAVCDWFGKAAWLRMKVDAHYLTEAKKSNGLRELTVNIVDYKTGKIYEEHKLQRSLYALGAFLRYPDAAFAVASHWYLDQGVPHKNTWSAADIPALKAEWARRTEAMLNDTTFAPRPGNYCRWCHFRKANDGPCQF